jgi:hypothetical protein
MPSAGKTNVQLDPYQVPKLSPSAIRMNSSESPKFAI